MTDSNHPDANEDPGTGIDSTVSAIDAPRRLEFSRSSPGEPLLLAAIEGVPVKFPFDRFKRTRAACRAKIAALG